MKLCSYFIFILLVSFSCRELVQDEFPDFTTIPTVNSILAAGEPIRVQVSLTGKLDTNKLVLVNNADVLLSVDGQFREKLTYAGDGIYYSSFNAEPDRTYSCEVNVDGFSAVTCTDSIPEASAIYDIIHINIAGKDEEGLTYPAVKFTFNNDPHKKLYYEVLIRLNPLSTNGIATLMRITDPLILNEGLPIAIFSNELINDSSYTITINYTTGSHYGGYQQPTVTKLFPLIIELRSVSYDYYRFVKQKYLYDEGRYPEFLAASVAAFPLYSNVKGGYGIFGAYSAVESDIIYP